MTSVTDPKTIGLPKRPRRHVRTLTGQSTSVQLRIPVVTYIPAGYLPEKDKDGKEKVTYTSSCLRKF